MAFCSNCGTQLNEGTKFCGKCGNPSVQPQHQQAASNTSSPQGATQNAASGQMPSPQQTQTPPKQKGGKKTLLIVVIIMVVGGLVCLIGAVVDGFGYGGASTSGSVVPENTEFYSIDMDSQVQLGTPINFTGGSGLAEELQWLAVHIACVGIYNMAQTGDYTMGDPTDYYQPSRIREFLTEQSGTETKTDMFYGICFNYAQAAYDDIMQNPNHYQNLGVTDWYIAGVFENPSEIVLMDPVPPESAETTVNGVSVKAASLQNVRTHGGATMHAWLWVVGNDGEIYWIDPTWTDNIGYPIWGIVRNGEEIQLNPLMSLCVEEANSTEEAFAYLNKGNAYYNRGDYDTAIENYNEALRIAPNYAEAYNNRGRAYMGKSDYNRAIADCGEALKIEPNYAAAYVNRASSYNQMDDHDGAIADYTEALRIILSDNPEGGGIVYSMRGLEYYNKGDYDRAIADYTESLRINPNDVWVYNNRGFAYARKSDLDRAIADWEAVLRIDPNHAYAQDSIEAAQQQRGY